MPIASPAFHAALLKNLDQTDFADAVTILAPLVNEGMVAMNQPMPAVGSSVDTRSFFTLWMAALIENRHWPRDEEDWQIVKNWAPSPDWWSETKGPYQRETLFRKWVDLHNGSGFAEDEAEVLVDAGPKAWATWTNDNWQGAPPGARLAAHLMGLHQTRGGVDAVLPLFEQGVSWQAQWMTERGPGHLAANITTAAQWASYLRHGGDPEMPVSAGEPRQTLPLWQALTSSHAATPEFKKVVTDSLADRVPNAGNQARQDEVDKLFANMNTNLTTRANITALAERHGVDWTQLRDSQGRHVLMPWLRYARHAEFKALATSQKSHRLLHETDGQGRNAWAYLLGSDNPAEDVQRVLHTAKVPLVLDRHQRGLLFQLDRKDNEGFPAPSAWYRAKLTAKSDALLAQAPAWLSAPEDETAAYLAHRLDHKKYLPPTTAGEADTFSHLAHLWTQNDQDIGPGWRAAVCINELFTSNPDWAWIGEQVGKGIALQWSPDRPKQLEELLGPVTTTGNTSKGISEQRLAQSQAVLRLMQSMAQVPGAAPDSTAAERRRPRLRS